MKYQNMKIVSPDIGGVARARYFAKRMGLEMVIVDKRREKANESEVMNIIGDGKFSVYYIDCNKKIPQLSTARN